jgi:hypothetical protein
MLMVPVVELTDSTLMHHLGMSVLLVHGLEWAKKVSWLPTTANTDTLNRIIAFTIAFLTSCGIVFVAAPGGWINGGTIQIPPVQQMLNLLLHTVGQIGLQLAYYNGVVKENGPTIGQHPQEASKAISAKA